MQRTGFVPAPGVVFGLYPQRSETADAADRRRTPGAHRLRAHYRELAHDALRAAHEWQALTALGRDARWRLLRADLRRCGLVRPYLVDALGGVADAAHRTLGLRLFDTQLFAAAVQLDGALAEMATGEGKTYAAGAAAAVAAAAGIPVHVCTANDYLVMRDAEALAPWYAALGLRTGAIVAALDTDSRRAQYRADIVYCTARELVFDYLRDGLEHPQCRHELLRRAGALRGDTPAPRLRGLCMAILDEADSILLDDAVTPLVLAAQSADAQRRAYLWQAFAIARDLVEGEHFTREPAARQVQLSAQGKARIVAAGAPFGPLWHLQRRAEEAVSTALNALHAYRRDHDYVVQDGRVFMVDENSGRAAPGRMWAQGLHNAIELKEGVALSTERSTAAQITYQRFFPRYLRLAGMSGTLREGRRELRSVYGLRVVEVPLRRPSRRLNLAPRLILAEQAHWTALAHRIASLHARGQPVLVGTGSVADSENLAEALRRAGIPHRVLNARQDREEAAVIGQAGAPGAVTVATQMAGRGTDIVVQGEAAALGGLHVIDCLGPVPRRLSRQLAGRCARQGDAGSYERWYWLQPWRSTPAVCRLRSIFAAAVRHFAMDDMVRLPAWLLRGWTLAQQWMAERRCAEQRRVVLHQDRAWARSGTFAPTE